ncbi:MAG: recombinase family protein [Chloroflexi bacterium]|nr:recombinase family protein [Chloroflexota bacterium]
MTACAIYARVSTKDQADSGTSLSTQIEAARDRATRLGYDINERYVISEDHTGTDLDRPGLQMLIDGAGSGEFQVIVAYTLDRFYRPRESGDEWKVFAILDGLRKSGVEIEFVDSSIPTTGTLASVMGFLKVWQSGEERRAILERSMRGKRARAAQGRIPQGTGRGIFGYTYDPSTKTRVVDDAQAETVRLMFEMAAKGTSAHAISKRLTESAIPSFSGGVWHALTVRRMITNPAYKGEMIYGRTKRINNRVVPQPKDQWITIEGACPPIVSPQQWTDAQLGLVSAKPDRAANRGYLLTGFTICFHCGSPLSGHTMNRKFRYYRCRRQFANAQNKEKCGFLYQRADQIEEEVWSKILKVLSDPDLVLREMRRGNSGTETSLLGQQATLRSRIASHRDRENRLLRLYEIGQFELEELTSRIQEIQAGRRVAQDELDKVDRQLADLVALRDMQPTIDTTIKDVARKLEHADFEQKRLAFAALKVQITVSSSGDIDVAGAIPIDEPYTTIERTSA